MPTPANPDDLVVAKIFITRRLSQDEDAVYVRTIPRNMTLMESMGMLRLAEEALMDRARAVEATWDEDNT